MRRILVVDDDAHMSLAIQAWLKRFGFRVAVADGGPGGLAAIDHSMFDLMIVDIFMPHMRGLVRNYVVTQAQSLGYRALAASNARAALAIFDCGARIDLLFTDIVMPGSINGRRLAIEARSRRSSLKVLDTSAMRKARFLTMSASTPMCCCWRSPIAKPIWRR